MPPDVLACEATLGEDDATGQRHALIQAMTARDNVRQQALTALCADTCGITADAEPALLDLPWQSASVLYLNLAQIWLKLRYDSLFPVN